MTRHCLSTWTLACLLTAALPANGTECRLTRVMDFPHKEIGSIPVYQHEPTGAVLFASIMHVNPDGAPDAYHPDDVGTVHLCNGMRVNSTCNQDRPWIANCMADYRKAKAEGFSGKTQICFFAMATRDGVPVIQGKNDPNPGYFVSLTRFQQPGQDRLHPDGQVNSNVVPFAVIPGTWHSRGVPGPELGDVGIAFRRSNGAVSGFAVADTGPANKLGEGSVALLQALGHDPFVMRYGKRRAFSGIGFLRNTSSRRIPDVVYAIFPNTAEPGSPISADGIKAKERALLESLGGIEGIQACAAKL